VRATTRWACLGLAGVLALGGCTARTHPADDPVAEPPPVDGSDDPDAAEPDAADPGAAGGPDGVEAGDAGVTAGRDAPADERPSTEAGPLDFTARTLDGGVLDASRLAGRHVIVWMWTPW
jgi:hypothetical protein